MQTKEIRNKIEQCKGQKQQVLNTITHTKTTIIQAKEDIKNHEKAHEIIKEVGLRTQEQLQFQISDITSLALDAVFPDDPYELKVDFIQRRNKTECDLFFIRDGKEIDPMTASGGGAVDVAAFALRVASWSMKNPKTRPVIVLDEPMRFLSSDRQEQAALMIQKISQKLGIQFIIVTHEEALTQYADQIIKVNKKGKFSKIKG